MWQRGSGLIRQRAQSELLYCWYMGLVIIICEQNSLYKYKVHECLPLDLRIDTENDFITKQEYARHTAAKSNKHICKYFYCFFIYVACM